MGLSEFRTKDKYQESRHKFTNYALRQAFVEAEKALQSGRSIDYDVLKTDPTKLNAFQGTVGSTLLDIAKKAFPAGLFDWTKLNDPTVTPQQKAESIDDITFGLFGVGARSASTLVKRLADDDAASFDNLYFNGTKMSEAGLARHVSEAYNELSGSTAIADFKSTIVDAGAITALEEHNGYRAEVMGALVKMYDQVNKGKAPADIRKLSKEDVMKLLKKSQD